MRTSLDPHTHTDNTSSFTDGHSVTSQDSDHDINSDHPFHFSFPTLSSDGSLEDLLAFRCTPPAALSSLGVRARPAPPTDMDTLANSISSLAESSYDMVDDVSDFSTGDHETASIISTDHPSDAEALLSDDQELDEDEREAEEIRQLRAQFNDYPSEPCSLRHFEQIGGHTHRYEDVDETPRQSVVDPRFDHDEDTRKPGLTANLKRTGLDLVLRPITRAFAAPGSERYLAILWIVGILTAVLIRPYVFAADRMAETHTRRAALSTALGKFTNATVDIDHLLPLPETFTAEFMGRKSYSWPTSFRHQAVAPNHMVFSMPRFQTMFSDYPKINSIHVHKGDKELEFNKTKLLEGVYDVTIDQAEAYGIVTIIAFAVQPLTDSTMKFDFGSRVFQRQTYGNAGKEVSKAVSERGTHARNSARSICERIQQEIATGASATTNLTTQLAVAMTRDVQLFVNATSVLLEKVGNAANDAVKDLSVVTTKEMVIKRFNHARKNARTIRGKVFGRIQDANDIAVKEIEKLTEPGSLVYCMRSLDFTTCRSGYTKALSTFMSEPFSRSKGKKGCDRKTMKGIKKAAKYEAKKARKAKRAERKNKA